MAAIPSAFLIKAILLLSILIVSPTAPPTIGTIFPTKNLSVLEAALSRAEANVLLAVTINTIIIMINDIEIVNVFLIKALRELSFNVGAIAVQSDSAIDTLQTALRRKVQNVLQTPKNNISPVELAAAALIFPPATYNAAVVGIIPLINAFMESKKPIALSM